MSEACGFCIGPGMLRLTVTREDGTVEGERWICRDCARTIGLLPHEFKRRVGHATQ